MFEYIVSYINPLGCGLLFGTIYFIFLCDLEINNAKTIKKHLVYHILFVTSALMFGYIVYINTSDHLAYWHSVRYNPTAAMLMFGLCIVRASRLFGWIDNRGKGKTLSFLVDLYLYVFLISAYLMSSYIRYNAYALVLVMAGFNIPRVIQLKLRLHTIDLN